MKQAGVCNTRLQAQLLGADFCRESQQKRVVATFFRRVTLTIKNIGIMVKPAAPEHENAHT